jgi:murein DD-endopeptidase MepM/ murein hydrolase activator NlpD
MNGLLPSGDAAGTFWATRANKGVEWVHAAQDYRTEDRDIGIYIIKAGVALSEGWHDEMGWHVIQGALDAGIIRYMHLRERAYVRAGQPLPQGLRIGEMGSTGFSSGPHLHLDIAFSTPAQALAELMSLGYSESEAKASMHWRINNAFIDPVKVIGVEQNQEGHVGLTKDQENKLNTAWSKAETNEQKLIALKDLLDKDDAKLNKIMQKLGIQ